MEEELHRKGIVWRERKTTFANASLWTDVWKLLEVVKSFSVVFSKALVSNLWRNFGTRPGTAKQSQLNGHPTTGCFPRNFSIALWGPEVPGNGVNATVSM